MPHSSSSRMLHGAIARDAVSRELSTDVRTEMEIAFSQCDDGVDERVERRTRPNRTSLHPMDKMNGRISRTVDAYIAFGLCLQLPQPQPPWRLSLPNGTHPRYSALSSSVVHDRVRSSRAPCTHWLAKVTSGPIYARRHGCRRGAPDVAERRQCLHTGSRNA